MVPWLNFLAVGCGAVLGAWARWGFAILLNPMLPTLPLGTLLANLVGGFVIGLFMGAADPLSLAPATRLLVATGFLGAFTTFSAFSAETMTLLLRAQYAWAAAAVAAHVGGSLFMTWAGMALVRAVLGR